MPALPSGLGAVRASLRLQAADYDRDRQHLEGGLSLGLKSHKAAKPKRVASPMAEAKAEAGKVSFLEAYATVGTISHAAKLCGVDARRHYEWLESDPEYPKRFKAARDQAVDTLEVEARRRAVEGVEEPAGWYKGEPGGYVRKYSDVLLIFLLKGARPDVYRERLEHTGPNGTPLDFARQVNDAATAMRGMQGAP